MTLLRDINSGIDAECDFDEELKELLKDEDGLVDFKDYSNMDDAKERDYTVY